MIGQGWGAKVSPRDACGIRNNAIKKLLQKENTMSPNKGEETTCRACGGDGKQEINGGQQTCPRCNGYGKVIVGQVKCPSCGGSGAAYGVPKTCNTCSGTGWVNSYK